MEHDRAFRFASAISDDEETPDAIGEAIVGVIDQLTPGELPGVKLPGVDLAIAFITPHHRLAMEEIVAQIRRDLSPRVLIGVTAAGVIGSGYEIETRPGIALLAGRMPGATLRPFCHTDYDWPSVKGDPAALREAILGEPDAEGAKTAGDVKAVLLLADPFTTPMVKLMPAINEALAGVPIIGGLASAAANPGDNRLIINDRIYSEGAVGVVIGGDVTVDTIVSQGCRPIGEPGVITRARKNLIQEIGQRTALSVVEAIATAAEPDERELMRQGIFVGRVINEYKDHFGRGDFLIRNIIGADREAGFLAVNDFVRIGQTVQFHVRDRRTAEEDLRLLLQTQMLHDADDPPAGVLMCTCNGRGRNLFDAPNAESAIIRSALGDVPMAGFFAAGEIGPIGDTNFVHGFTASLAIFRPLVRREGEEA